ncbi:ATP-binding cassette domain-containing protein [Streptococcus fryi]
MLKLTNVSLTHQKDLQPLIKNLNVTINPQDKVAIIGEEGTGKSTLMALLAKEKTVNDYVLVTGEISNHFSKTTYLPQILDEHTLKQTIHEFLYHDVDIAHYDYNILYQLASQLQFDSQRFDDNSQTIGELSGGERLKLQVIKALAQEPDLLLLDEPSSDLDLDSLLWLEHYIKTAPITIIFISHDEYLLKATANKLIHLEQVKKHHECRTTTANLDYLTYQQERSDSIFKQTQRAHKEREDHQKRLDKLNRAKSAVHHALNNTRSDSEGRLLKKKMKNLLSREKRFDKESQNFTPLPDNPDTINLTFTNAKEIKGHQALLIYEQELLETGQICDMTIYKQDKIAIVGQNGIGKSRLLHKLYQDLTKKYPDEVAYMPQTYQDILTSNQSVIDYLTRDKQEEGRQLLASLKFHRQEVEHGINQLSGGQMAKLLFAKMVLDRKTVLLLDEPTRYLSPTSQPEIRRLLKDFTGTLITVSHDRAFIHEVCNTVYELNQMQLKQHHLDNRNSL